ncbi:hypothetical protein ALP91_200259 [Pseudomonas savastanoi pv. glycinea]|nr:hypothetical protein ALO37_200197 [Pseudomonas savastanoi pv. glycinea]PYD17267.1 hypothetical protein DND36_29030 [Pseudomonas savastanoi pv. glycinea]RMP93527.1 hypothetical protein ALQ12_200108 [Pseudomonas savastanoi pv. glycinea]RMR23761.1 hypothetical protein ALP91_200259 [Pseudomonas savastanoi pv. glycinea]RMU28075.1 hypothetical protein ALP35_200083 [Pseudomonas savastanoi pv. glycinea]
MDNRTRYLQLLDTYGITQAKSAELIAAVTSRPCAVRTVRSWLNDPEKPSSTPCPDYAVLIWKRPLITCSAMWRSARRPSRNSPCL